MTSTVSSSRSVSHAPSLNPTPEQRWQDWGKRYPRKCENDSIREIARHLKNYLPVRNPEAYNLGLLGIRFTKNPNHVHPEIKRTFAAVAVELFTAQALHSENPKRYTEACRVYKDFAEQTGLEVEFDEMSEGEYQNLQLALRTQRDYDAKGSEQPARPAIAASSAAAPNRASSSQRIPADVRFKEGYFFSDLVCLPIHIDNKEKEHLPPQVAATIPADQAALSFEESRWKQTQPAAAPSSAAAAPSSSSSLEKTFSFGITYGPEKNKGSIEIRGLQENVQKNIRAITTAASNLLAAELNVERRQSEYLKEFLPKGGEISENHPALKAMKTASAELENAQAALKALESSTSIKVKVMLK